MRVFVTGVTGTIGTALAELHRSRGDEVFGCSRGEAAAQAWLARRPVLGTVFLCDAARLVERHSDIGRLLPTIDRAYHCAAMKHVDLCEANPDEATYQNVTLPILVAVACKAAGVPLVFASTDKACLPSGVYGATKLIAERAVTAAGGAAVRLANVAGSSGSVLHRWRQIADQKGRISVTDPEMTRFFMTAHQAALFMADHAVPGSVAVPRPLLAVRMGDLAGAFASLTGCGIEVTGPRPGESKHQWAFSPEEPAVAMDGKFVLGKGGMLGGLCSLDAPRWDCRELIG
jgi:UDP-N-acetylglucosamine 4,6-dehydratase